MTAPILCGCEHHGDAQPQLGTVENFTDPTAPYGYLCELCTGRWDAHFAANRLERTYPRHSPTTKRHQRCPVVLDGP